MNIFRLPHSLTHNALHNVVALGNFDGVHKGHQAIIHETIQKARAYGTSSAILTFEPHPANVLGKSTKHIRLTNFKEKMQLFRHYGIDHVFIIPFSKAFAKRTAESFVKDTLVQKLNVKHVVIGYDFIFGHQRQGNATYLQSMADQLKFGFSQLHAIGSPGQIYSSTSIRSLLKEGNVSEANQFLGRPFAIRGKVTAGDQRGRQLGFPTANIAWHDRLQPAFGVYAVRIHIDGYSHPFSAIANFGKRPTFKQDEPLLEVHILDFSDNLYGKSVLVEFLDFIRPEKTFPSFQILQEHIKRDIVTARHFHLTNEEIYAS